MKKKKKKKLSIQYAPAYAKPRPIGSPASSRQSGLTFPRNVPLRIARKPVLISDLVRIVVEKRKDGRGRGKRRFMEDTKNHEYECTFAGLLTLLPITFHLFASYSLIAASKAALFVTNDSIVSNLSQKSRYIHYIYSLLRKNKVKEAHLIFSKLCIVHILPPASTVNKNLFEIRDGVISTTYLVPVLLYAALCPRRKRLCNITPRATSIPHALESLLLRRRPRRVCPCPFHAT